MTDSDDRVDRALRTLRDDTPATRTPKDVDAHAIFDRRIASRNRRRNLRRLAAAAVIVALCGTAVGGIATRYFFVDVIDVENGPDGRPESMRLSIDASSEAILVPLSQPTMSDPSGDLHLVAAHDERGKPIMLEIKGMIPGVTTAAYEAVNVEKDPAVGQRLELRPMAPRRLTLIETATGARLLIARGARDETTIALTAMPDQPNSLTDGLVVIRVIRP